MSAAGAVGGRPAGLAGTAGHGPEEQPMGRTVMADSPWAGSDFQLPPQPELAGRAVRRVPAPGGLPARARPRGTPAGRLGAHRPGLRAGERGRPGRRPRRLDGRRVRRGPRPRSRAEPGTRRHRPALGHLRQAGAGRAPVARACLDGAAGGPSLVRRGRADPGQHRRGPGPRRGGDGAARPRSFRPAPGMARRAGRRSPAQNDAVSAAGPEHRPGRAPVSSPASWTTVPPTTV